MADNETIADVLAAMRDEGRTGESSCLEWVGAKMRHYADRFEAAHDHDVDTATDAASRSVVGACVKLREAERKCVALREALERCREIALQWQADEAAGVAGTTDKQRARSAAEAVIDMEFEINAALAATEKKGGDDENK